MCVCVCVCVCILSIVNCFIECKNFSCLNIRASIYSNIFSDMKIHLNFSF